MGLFSSRKRNPDDVAIVMDVPGYCGNCRRPGNARLVAYYSGEVIIRCGHCKKAGDFVPSDATYNDPHKFAPFIFDDDETGDDRPSRHTRGKR